MGILARSKYKAGNLKPAPQEKSRKIRTFLEWKFFTYTSKTFFLARVYSSRSLIYQDNQANAATHHPSHHLQTVLLALNCRNFASISVECRLQR